MTVLQRVELAVSQALNRRGFYLGRRSTRIHSAIYRRTRGRIGSRMPGFAEVGIVLVDHIGARSGVRRTSPVMFLRDGESIVVAASKAGQPANPSWFHNLMAHPETTAQIGSQVLQVRARVADEHERERLWPRFVAMYPAFEFYARNAAPREVPVVILEPRLRSSRHALPARDAGPVCARVAERPAVAGARDDANCHARLGSPAEVDRCHEAPVTAAHLDAATADGDPGAAQSAAAHVDLEAPPADAASRGWQEDAWCRQRPARSSWLPASRTVLVAGG